MKRAQEVTETPDAADAFAPVMSKEGEMHDSRKQKDDSPASLPAGLVRRPPPGRGELTRVAVAAGLALLLSACGGGGGGAGAPNFGAALGGSAPSIQADAVVAPALVAPTPDAEQAAPVARNSPPGDGETPPPTGLPPVAEIPSQIQEPPTTPTDRYTVADPSTIPFPSGSPVTDEKVSMNSFGTWGLPDYQPGGASAAKNNGPNVRVRRRVGYGRRLLTLPVSGGTGEFAYTSLYYGTAAIANLWLTYPADAGAGDLAVHIHTRRATPGGYGSISDDAVTSAAVRNATGVGAIWSDEIRPDAATRGTDHKAWVGDWLEAAARLGPSHGFTVEDFFLTEAYLQAPGTAVQPAPQGSETSATWTGKVIAFNSAAGSILTRGDEIGGDATVTVNFGAGPTMDVSLTDLRSARGFAGQGPTEPNGGFTPYRYPNQTWTGLALAGGGFSDSSSSRSIKGVFRSQVQSTGTNANTVGGIFDVFGTMKGGFVATFAPPSPE
ncbi:MAG: hypothetical protein OXG62_00140 [Nitrospinae bacterium]|nr:hypothetical protein [Nitrospinota bacterium]